MARRTPSSSPNRSTVEAALDKGMTIVDPATGVPVKELLLDPNVVGEGEDVQAIRDEPGDSGVQAERGPVGIQLLVDMSADDWEEKVAEAFKAAQEEFGFEYNPDQPTEILTRG